MSLKIGAAALAGIVALATPAIATTVTIDFENFAGLPTVGGGLQEGVNVQAGQDIGGGLSFDAVIRVGQFGFLQNSPATSGFIAVKEDGLFNPRTFDLVGTFTGTVSSLTLGAGDLTNNPPATNSDLDFVTLSGFAADGTLIDSASFTARDAQFISIAGAGIKFFELDVNSGGFDNISFNQEVAAVPVPAGLPLALLGLGSLAVLRRHQQAG